MNLHGFPSQAIRIWLKKNVRRPVNILVLNLMNVYIFRCYESVWMCVFLHTYALTKHAEQKNKLTCLNAGGETG